MYAKTIKHKFREFILGFETSVITKNRKVYLIKAQNLSFQIYFGSHKVISINNLKKLNRALANRRSKQVQFDKTCAFKPPRIVVFIIPLFVMDYFQFEGLHYPISADYQFGATKRLADE